MDTEKCLHDSNERVDRLIERLTVVERDLAVLRANHATKADLHETEYTIMKWTAIALLLSHLLWPLLR